MKATTEMEIRISGGRIVKAQTWTDGTCRLTIEIAPKSEEKPKSVHSNPTAKTSETTERTGGYGPGMSAFWDDEWGHTGCP